MTGRPGLSVSRPLERAWLAPCGPAWSDVLTLRSGPSCRPYRWPCPPAWLPCFLGELSCCLSNCLILGLFAWSPDCPVWWLLACLVGQLPYWLFCLRLLWFALGSSSVLLVGRFGGLVSWFPVCLACWLPSCLATWVPVCFFSVQFLFGLLDWFGLGLWVGGLTGGWMRRCVSW